MVQRLLREAQLPATTGINIHIDMNFRPKFSISTPLIV